MPRKMKDSGIEWIGEIPEGWEVKKLKYVAQLNPAFKRGKIGDVEVSFIPMECLGNNNFSFKNAKLDDVINSYTYFADNDIIMAKVTPCFENGNIAQVNNLINGIGFGTTEIYVFRSLLINSKYLLYSLQSEDFRQNAISTMYGTGGLKRVSSYFIANYKFVMPSSNTQTNISKFLDLKCSAIDKSIELQELSIEKLQEYKKAIITEIVTKGLNPNVLMKDSGIEWIGEVPESWRISRVRNEFNNLDGLRRPVNSENRGDMEGQYPYYGASGIIDKINDYIFENPYILIGEDGANLKFRNLPLIYIGEGKYWVNNHAHILDPVDHNHLQYMAYQLECVDLSNFITGSTQPKLTQGNLSIIPVIVPTLSEQQAIVAYLNKKCATIDKTIAERQGLIEKLTEYKKSLIYEAVTGNVEV
ncbi:hypothetical protein FACS1894110_12510 [Spirochaetia bacterium]|nr:hypothetical protein FACS1894110_12510 [Spirochaetia bacterium]